jgi:hypothetical protein
MKQLAQFLFILSCTSYAYDQSKIKKIAKAAINKELTTRCGTNNCRGPRGKKGPRGDRGPRGRRGKQGLCGLNELFLNANMMTGINALDDLGLLSPVLFFPYGPEFSTASVNGWELQPDIGVVRYTVGANFDIPIDLDRTQPVTVVLHFLVQQFGDPGNQAKIQLQADYKNNDQELGALPPATGFADTQVSPDFTIVEPINPANLEQVSISIPLDTSKITGDWAILQIKRIAPASNEYINSFYLSTISVQYTRICA